MMGTLGLAAAIINITIGGGIFRLPANVAASLGPAAPLAYLVCAVAMGLIVLCIADAGSRVSLTGGPYAYVGTAFGRYVGFISGVLLWMLGTFATAAVSTVFASSLGLLVSSLGGRGMEIGILVVAFAFWSLVNLRGVSARRAPQFDRDRREAPAAVAGCRRRRVFRRPGRTSVATTPAAADVARTSLLLIFAFAGIEWRWCRAAKSATRRAPCREPSPSPWWASRPVHRTAGGGARDLGSGLAHATVSPLAEAAGASLGGWARTLLLTGATVSMFGYLGGMTLSMPRMLFALARDGFLPRALATVHPVHRAPQTAIVVQSLLALALAVSGTFERLAILANVSALGTLLRVRAGGVAAPSVRHRRRGRVVSGAAWPLTLATGRGRGAVAGLRCDCVAAHWPHRR